MSEDKRPHYSKDPITFCFSAQDFFRTHNWFFNKNNEDILLLDEASDLKIHMDYYKFTTTYLVCVHVGFKLTNFGENVRPQIWSIDVVKRDGSELDLLKKKVLYLRNRHANPNKIVAIEKVIPLIPPYKATSSCKTHKPFCDYITDLGYKMRIDNLPNEYVVLDLETNGLRPKYDDVLSISIFDPQTGLCYNRFLPLDYQPVVLTTRINGITQKELESCEHITQQELDELISTFKLKERKVLVYSGGNGTFDSSFFSNYCKRHGLKGTEDLQYENIKDRTPYLGYEYAGIRSKDNYCKLFGIDGVTNIHSGANDCLLEWKLFETILTKRPFVNNGSLFSFSDDYIVPVTALLSQPILGRYKQIPQKIIVGIPTLIYQYEFPPEVIKELKPFPSNITGIAIENALYSLIAPQKQDNLSFLLENKQKCQFISRIDSNTNSIPVETKDDGTLRSLNPKYNDYIAEVNAVSKVFTSNIKDVVCFIKNTLFKNALIRSEELVVSEDRKVLAVCDLSTDDAILEIKTTDVLNTSQYTLFNYEHIRYDYALQLYYEANGRRSFIMSIMFNGIDEAQIKIYAVDLIDKTEESKGKKPSLPIKEQDVLELIRTNKKITILQMAIHLNRSTISIQRSLEILRSWQYVKREGSKRTGEWVILEDKSQN